ncbi:S-adenosyl-L-methionine-dependent methyltransferase [Plectosphaerella cucumerina]|uniref:S-adenosyl-L-methionine-dependent methyltransferase n=1 Tax=Plectosphaerella cucumerina TaxID=40658 RepID=A0A8K0X9X4_9PEZI|nr:S-adenosyl-L-methionine-dependent methyltransferase [Plectosphaerella cucumerina]
MAQNLSTLTALAARIAKSAEVIDSFLKENQLPEPSFEADGPKNFPVTDKNPEILAARDELIDCTQELRDLVVGPTDTIKWRTMVDHTFTASLQAIYRFKIAQAVPLEGEITIADLSKATGLAEVDVARIMRCAAVHRVFQEKTVGSFSHTATSALLAQDKGMQALLGHMTDGAFPAAAKMCDFLEKYPGSQEPGESPYTMTFGSPMFARGAAEPHVMQRFIDAMTAWSTGDGSEGMVKGFDWAKLGAGKVVDVGGAAGHISLAVASRFPALTFAVQDVLPTKPHAEGLIASFPADVASRVQWQAHDFFDPQPAECRGAAAYILRYICHDWPDRYASKILANVAEAMTTESSLIIADAVLPPREVKLPRAQEAILRGFDISMLCQLNARERAIEDWTKLLKMADERFEIVGVTPPEKAGEVSIIEAKLRV